MTPVTWRLGLSLSVLLLALAAPRAEAQRILLDEPVRAGELTLFPDLADAKAFYYVPDKPRLAVVGDAPQFSFLRYVQNVRSDPDAPEAREGEGGGIVHALVQLGVTPEQLRDARRELQRVKPGARIVGPVVFRSGKFGLVSAFADTKGSLTRQVVGLGNAPILDGEKAAVSVQLTKIGAKTLWESFEMPTPDVSFTFEMQVAGYRAPTRGVIEADFDQIYEHQSFAAGVASTYVAGEIKAAFDDLWRSGAIRVTQVGDDANLNALLTTAYNKIAEAMFAPAGGSGTPSLGQLAPQGAGQQSLLDRATARLKEARAEAAADNQAIRQRNDAIRSRNQPKAEQMGQAAEAAETERRLDGEAAAAKAIADSLARRLAAAEKRTAELQALAEAKGAGTSAAKALATSQKQVETLRKQSAEALERADALSKQAGTARAEAARLAAAAPKELEPLEKEVTTPAFSVVACYELKKVRQRGTMKVDLNKYTADLVTLRFDENIGDLRALKADASHFRAVNLEDPLVQQREVVVLVDGLGAQDFGQYVNFVTVQLRKRHAGGAETHDEVRIDRNNFNREGNAFKLLYGWKGDDDRRKWLDYEYRTTWSFFGGRTVEVPWQKASAGAIALAPSYERRVVDVEAAAEGLAAAEVRSVGVKVFYELAGSEMAKQVTLNPAKSQLSEKVELLLPAGKQDYAYEVTWRLRGNRVVSSGRRTASESLLYVDELPEH